VREPVAPEEEFRRAAVAALEARDWYGAHTAAKGWIVGGGGAWIVDPWLVYVGNALRPAKTGPARWATERGG